MMGLALGIALGCASKVPEERNEFERDFLRVQAGMSLEEVEAIMAKYPKGSGAGRGRDDGITYPLSEPDPKVSTIEWVYRFERDGSSAEFAFFSFVHGKVAQRRLLR